MDKKIRINSIKKNATINIIFTLVNIVAPMITFPYITRVLLAELIGKVTFFSAIGEYGILFASLGIAAYGIREVAKNRYNNKELSKVVKELLIINITMSFIVVSLLLISSLFINRFKSDFILFAINLIIILFSSIELDWFYSGLEQYSYITIQSIIFRIISIILIFSFVKSKEDYLVYACIISFSTVGRSIINYIYAHKYVTFNIKERIEIKKHFKPMLILFVSSLAVSIYTNLDTVMLDFISGDRQVGLYYVAVKVKVILLTAINAISAVLYPRLAYYLSNNRKDEYESILRKSISIIFLIAIPASLFFIINAENSVIILAGKDFIEASLCMQIIMPILLLSSFSNITGSQVLMPYGKDKLYMRSVITGAVTDLILNLILMPKYGCIGAAIATLIAELVQATLQFYYAKDEIKDNINTSSLIKIVVATIFATLLILIVNPLLTHINIIIGLIISACIYGIAYLAVLLVSKEETTNDILISVFRRKTHE